MRLMNIKSKKKIAVLAVLLLMMPAIAGCTTQNSTSQTSVEAGTGTDTTNISAGSVTTIDVSDITNQYDEEDTDSSWDESTATKVELNNTSIEVDGEGAVAEGSILTISAAGTYVLNGTLSDGQILITAADGDTVRLVLNGVDITCKTGAPIYASAADKLNIILADGTENTVTDGGENFSYANTTDEEPDAAVFSKCDLTINGSGTLTVNAGFNNGIGTKDDLVIAGGNFIIDAANHGIRGRDSLTILGGEFEITAGNDGIQSNNNEDTSKGWIYLEAGVFRITSGCDGIQAETILAVAGGDYEITAGGGLADVSSADSANSYKGLKATADLSISGGTFNINSADDSIHANGNISISSGDFNISSGDDGVHADSDLSVSGGNINISNCYEGLEGATVNILGGTINIISSDDAINAAGGSDTGEGGKFGEDSFGGAAGSYYINISGGDINYYAGGDGIDSNGDINISGGAIIGIINSTQDNGAIDCDGTFTATGGTMIYGGSGIGQTPSGDSTQSYVYVSSGVSANTQMSVQKGGETLIDFILEYDCQYLAVSTPDIAGDESYDVYNGTALLTTVTAGTGAPEGMGGMGGQDPGQGGRGGQRR